MLERIRIALRVAMSTEMPAWVDDGRAAIWISIASMVLSVVAIVRT